MCHKKTVIFAFIFFAEYSSGFLTNIKNKIYLKDELSKNNVTNWDIDRRRSWNDGPVPEYFDWRDQGAVSPVKDQGVCAACWAFAIIANIESQIKLSYNKELKLSEQFLIDCLKSSGGCSYGSIMQSLSEIISDIGGVLEEKDYYPYASQKLECRWDRNRPLVPVIGAKRVFHDEVEMVKHLFHVGPLIAAINSKSMNNNYKPGVIDEPTDENCDPGTLDHTVLIVGYNVYVNHKTNQRVPYWIIKNSWGEGWGDKGYYYLVRGRNACGIASDVSYAYVK